MRYLSTLTALPRRFGEVSQAMVFPYGIVAVKWLKVRVRCRD